VGSSLPKPFSHPHPKSQSSSAKELVAGNLPLEFHCHHFTSTRRLRRRRPFHRHQNVTAHRPLSFPLHEFQALLASVITGGEVLAASIVGGRSGTASRRVRAMIGRTSNAEKLPRKRSGIKVLGYAQRVVWRLTRTVAQTRCSLSRGSSILSLAGPMCDCFHLDYSGKLRHDVRRPGICL